MVMNEHDPLGELKKDLRRELRQRTLGADPVRKVAESAATATTVLALLARLGEPAVASYLPMIDELDLGEVHRQRWSRGLPVWMPRIMPNYTLAWHPITSAAHVRSGTFSILEPDPDLAPAADLPLGTVVLVPGVGLGINGRRLGRGKGYYDRALARADLIAIGVGFSWQRCDHVPMEPHDRHVHGVVLGGSVIRDPLPAGA